MLRIGVAQIINSTQLERNFSTIEAFLQRFSTEGVDLVLFPECSLSGFSAKMRECSLDRLQPFLSSIQKWSKNTGIAVVLPTAISENGKVYNSGFFFDGLQASRFQKLGLTESEQKFFSVSDESRRKVFTVKGYRFAVLICMEAQQDPWAHFQPQEADIILWPGYWGWTHADKWGPHSSEAKPNLVYQNMSAWQLPLVQANFAVNDLGDTRSTGPEGLSVVIDEKNTLRHQGEHLCEGAFIATFERDGERCVYQNCQALT